ncbi:MAG TPA: sialidase family protein [Pyrinomonadaceae bacterium]|nr:sialidase family protein [Pyrinomonadaceae bacterium]
MKQATVSMMSRLAAVFAVAALAAGCATAPPASEQATRLSSSNNVSSNSSSNGSATVQDAAATQLLSAPAAKAAEPALASAPDGTVFALWVEHAGEGGADVMLARVGADGRRAGESVRVNPRAGQAKSWRGDPPTVAVAHDGTVYVGWTARVESENKHANDLYLSASRDGGRTFSPPVKVNDDKRPGVHGMHSLAVDDAGRVHLAWLDERNLDAHGHASAPKAASQPASAPAQHMERNRDVFTAFSDDGGRSISPNRLIAREACPCCKTAVAVGAEGRVYVGWRQVLPGDLRHIAVAASADGGQTFSESVNVSDDRWTIGGCPVSGPALGVDTEGALRVAWYTEGDAGAAGLYESESRDGGRTFAPRRALSQATVTGSPSLTKDARGRYVAVWQEGTGAEMRLMSAPLSGGAGDVAAGARAASALGNGQLPAAAVSGGHLFVLYLASAESERGVWLRRA